MGDIEQLQRSKRYLSFFSGLLFLDLIAGLTREGAGTFFGVDLDELENVELVLSFVVLFYFIRTLNFRTAEGEGYRASLQYRIDDYGHLFIAANAILNGILHSVYLDIYNQFGAFLVIFILAFLSFVSVFLGLLILRVLRRFSAQGRVSSGHTMLSVLRVSPWYLIFANNVGQTLKINSNYKEISFLADGDIGLGRNHNEHRWRVMNGFLEILNDKNEIFSRFSYDKEREMFRATGDSDLLAFPQQRIVRDVDKWDSDGRP